MNHFPWDFFPYPKVQHYGDAALIFATHDGYPQIVNGLLYNQELGAEEREDGGFIGIYGDYCP